MYDQNTRKVYKLINLIGQLNYAESNKCLDPHFKAVLLGWIGEKFRDEINEFLLHQATAAEAKLLDDVLISPTIL